MVIVFLPNIMEKFLIILHAYYSQNYAGIMYQGLTIPIHKGPFIHATIAIHKEPFLHAIIAIHKEPFLHATIAIQPLLACNYSHT